MRDKGEMRDERERESERREKERVRGGRKRE